MNAKLRKLIFLLALVGGFSGIRAQYFNIGLEGGLGVQSIEETQAVLSSGWQVVMLPQLGLRFRLRNTDVLGQRFGFQLLRKGGRVPVTSADYPDAPAATGHLIAQGSYFAMNYGLSAGGDLGESFRLEGFAEFVVGYLVKGSYRNTLYPQGHPGRTTEVSGLFNNFYLGIHLGALFAARPAKYVQVWFQPTLEAQLNYAFRSNVFKPRFIGFSPMVGIGYDLW